MFELLQISDWIITDYGKWEIKDDAPEDAKKIFYNFQQAYANAVKKGEIVE